MKVAKLYSYNDIRIEEMDVPRPGPGEALMKVHASGICSGDTMAWYIEKKAPLVLGHEPAGEIVEIGEDVSIVKVGDRVFTHHHAPCFTCVRCRRGNYVHCETWRRTGLIPGGIAEYILIPRTNLENDTLEIEDSMSYEDGALMEPLACVLKGLQRALIRKEDTALVIGLGFMGIVNAMMLKNYGAGKVFGADRSPWRMHKALELGADDVVDVNREPLPQAVKRLTDGLMANIVVVTPNSVEALETALQCVAPSGTVLMFTPTLPGERLTIDPNYLYFNDISLIPSYSAGPGNTADALAVLGSGGLRAEQVVTHRFPIEETAEAFRMTAQAGDSLKCMITFD